MPRRGRLDEFLHDEDLDEDETGATVVMQGSMFDEEDDSDADSDAATVMMGAADVSALLEEEGVLEDTFDPWVAERTAPSESTPRPPAPAPAPEESEPPELNGLVAGLLVGGVIVAAAVAIAGVLML